MTTPAHHGYTRAVRMLYAVGDTDDTGGVAPHAVADYLGPDVPEREAMRELRYLLQRGEIDTVPRGVGEDGEWGFIPSGVGP